MKFLCGSCRTKYQISDEKVRGKILTIRCKKCGAKVMVKESLSRQGDVVIAPVSDEQKEAEVAEQVVHREAAHGLAAGAGTLASAFDVAMRAAPDDMPTAIAPTPSNQAEAGVEWYTASDGKQSGPFAFGELVQRVRDGVTQPRHYVWRDGYDGWKRVRDVPDLAQLIPQEKKRPPPPPPAPVEPPSDNVVDFASRRAERERSNAAAFETDEDPTKLERAHSSAPGPRAAGRAEELDSVLNDALGIEGEGATTQESPKKASGTLEGLAASSAIFTSTDESSVPSAVPEDLFDMVPRASSNELVSRESTRFFVAAAGVQHQKSRDRLGVFIGFAAAVLLVGFFGLWGTGVIAISIPGLGNPFDRGVASVGEAEADEAELTELERQMLEGLKGQARRRAAETIVRQRKTKAVPAKGAGAIEYVNEDGSGSGSNGRGSRGDGAGEVGIGLPSEGGVAQASLGQVALPGGNPDEVPLPDTSRLDEGMITQVVNSNRKAIAACYQRALKGAGPDGLGGKITFQVTVEPDGSVSKARVAAGKFQGTEIARCMTAKMRDWRFPAFRGPAQNIEIPIVLQQSAF